MNASTSWVKQVPPTWRVARLKTAGTYLVSNVDKLSAEVELPVRLCNYNDVYKNDYITPDMDFMRATALPREIKKFGLRDGDVVITKDSETWDDIGIPALVRKSAPDLVCGYHLAILRGKAGSLSGEFLFRCLQSKTIRIQLELAANGVTRYGIANDEIGRILLPIPPGKIQDRIADFLDRETSRIDGLIERKAEMLRLLEEKRASLISNAVTRGLNSSVRLRNSGIPWLRQMPAHWGVCSVKRIASVEYGLSLELDRTNSTGTPIFSLPNVKIDGTLNTDDIPRTPLTDAEKKTLLLKHGDLLFNWRNGSSDHLGKTAFFDLTGEYTHVGFLLRIRFNQRYDDPRFYHHFLNGLRSTGFFASSKAGVNNTFNQDELRNLYILRPPFEEQQKIARFVTCKTKLIDELRGALENSIAYLRERRSALVDAAVTGIIDVQGAEKGGGSERK
jgi:type I restriction enzyme S subunit